MTEFPPTCQRAPPGALDWASYSLNYLSYHSLTSAQRKNAQQQQMLVELPHASLPNDPGRLQFTTDHKQRQIFPSRIDTTRDSLTDLLGLWKRVCTWSTCSHKRIYVRSMSITADKSSNVFRLSHTLVENSKEQWMQSEEACNVTHPARARGADKYAGTSLKPGVPDKISALCLSLSPSLVSPSLFLSFSLLRAYFPLIPRYLHLPHIFTLTDPFIPAKRERAKSFADVVRMNMQ